MPPVVIREYQPADVEQWLRCRVLAFLHTAYYDDVLRAKPAYANSSIELVAQGAEVIGFIDIEVETRPETTDADLPRSAGMIWHLGVHPDHHRRGIARRLMEEAIRRSRAIGLTALEAWTRDDAPARALYEAFGFRQFSRYWHVYMDGKHFETSIPGLHPVRGFADYVGSDIAAVRPHCTRLHECVGYLLELRPDTRAALGTRS